MTACTEHDYIIVKKSYQTISSLHYQVLDHSVEALVCKRCGHIVDPWFRPTPDQPYKGLFREIRDMLFGERVHT